MLKSYNNIEIAWNRLKEYLGDTFDSTLTDFPTCCAFSTNEVARYGDRFYQESYTYLYELTHFHFSPYKERFFHVIVNFMDFHSLSQLGDFGCGIGLDAQALMQYGYEVELFDFESSSSEYLRWRLRRDLKREVKIRDIYNTPLQQRYDLVYAVDVLEHAINPFLLIRRLFAAGDYVCINLFPHETRKHVPIDLHFPLNHWKLLPAMCELGTLLQVENSGDTVVTLWKTIENN
ncbi:conserved hypothetical protein [Beggiatoa sp. PS]|nr:conserved hypothetical protein [Beggiatoa sp. PS]